MNKETIQKLQDKIVLGAIDFSMATKTRQWLSMYGILRDLLINTEELIQYHNCHMQDNEVHDEIVTVDLKK